MSLTVVLDGGREVTVVSGEVASLDREATEVVTRLVRRRRARGELRVHGAALRGGPSSWSRRGLAVVLRDVAADLTVVDQLRAVGGAAEVEGLLQGCPRLRGRGPDLAGVLSGGERQAVGWIRAELLRPQVVILPDALAGFDAEMHAWATAMVDGWVERGVAVARADQPE